MTVGELIEKLERIDDPSKDATVLPELSAMLREACRDGKLQALEAVRDVYER